jgi:hypothetical protein
VVALLEVAINRVLIGGSQLEPALASRWIVAGVEPPAWHTALSYVGLFLFYFSGTLAAALLGARSILRLSALREPRQVVAHVALLAATAANTVPLIISGTSVLSLPVELLFAVAVGACVIASFGVDRDVGAQLGLFIVAAPLLLHSVNVLGARFLWPEGAFDTPGVTVAHAGVLSLCVAALLSPYVFAPRPFALAVTRPLPIIVAMCSAALGALSARLAYASVARAATLAIGVEVSTGQVDARLALYLLAIATLAWTLVSCAISRSEARRTIGAGLALILLGGYAFRWPNHYLLPLLGLSLIGDATRRVRDEELAAMPVSIGTPVIPDAAWASYLQALTLGLKRSIADVHGLTTRGERGLTSSLVIGEKEGLNVRVRLERIEGCVVALDVVCGREIDELRGATLCLWAIPPRQLGVNPAGPTAAPAFRTGDPGFDDRFRLRGSAIAFGRLFDDGLRARAVATLDGWLAYWESEGLRYRVYPGRGAPLDHPMPLSDLALERPGSAERLVAVIELLVELAGRGVPAPRSEQPSQLEQEPTA